MTGNEAFEGGLGSTPLPLTAVLLTASPCALIAEGFLLLLGIAGGVGAFLRNAPGDAVRFEPPQLTPMLPPCLDLGLPELEADI